MSARVQKGPTDSVASKSLEGSNTILLYCLEGFDFVSELYCNYLL